MNGFGSGLLQAMMAVISVAAIALLVGHASGVASIVEAGTTGFDAILKTIELQD